MRRYPVNGHLEGRPGGRSHQRPPSALTSQGSGVTSVPEDRAPPLAGGGANRVEVRGVGRASLS